MATKSQAESVILRLENQVSNAADAMMGSLGRLEAQIERERGALGRLEGNLALAAAKLTAMSQGSIDPRAVAAFEKQGAAVAELEAKLKRAHAVLGGMAAAESSPAALAKAIGVAEQLSSKLSVAKNKLDELQAATSAKVDVEAYRKQSAAVAAMGDKVGAQKGKIEALKEKLSQGGKSAQSMGESAHALGNHLGVTNSSTAQLVTMLAKMGPYGALAAAALLGVVAAVSMFVGVIVGAISQSGAMRDELLKLQAASVNSAGGFNWLYNSTRTSRIGAEQMQESISRVADTVALARDKVTDYGIQLRKAGFQGQQLETALSAMAVAGAVGGEAMAGQFLESARAARYFGQSVDVLADRVQQKLGGVAAAQMLKFDVQIDKLKKDIGYMFSGADIEPFLRGMQSVLSLFGRNEAGAKGMRDMITRMTEIAIGGMLRLAITLVRTYIAIRTNETAWGGVTTAFKTIVFVAKLLAVVVGVTLVAAVASLVAVWGTSLAMWSLVRLAITFVHAKLVALFAWMQGKSLSGIGRAMVEGIAQGILGGGAAVLKALKSVVSGAVDGVKSFLLIRSPSAKLDKEVGYQMPAGMAGGAERGEGLVHDAMANVAQAGVMGAKSGAGNVAPSSRRRGDTDEGGGESSSGPQFVFQNCTFGGDLNETIVRRMMRKVFEAESMSAPEPA